MQKKKLISFGEMLIDFSPAGKSAQGGALFEKNPGGAPANLAVQAARLGIDAAFVGKVGDDAFGHFLKQTLTDCGVNTDGMLFDPQEPTSLAFVELDANGDRSFSFYRRPGADACVRMDELPKALLQSCDLFHFGSLLCTAEPGRSTTFALAEQMRTWGKIVSYDPNWRPALWADKEEGIAQMRRGVGYCHIIKVSDEELALLSGEESIEDGIAWLQKRGVQVAAVTLGAKGCIVVNRTGYRHCPTYDTNVKDTTGSGDSFFGAFLSRLLSGGKMPADYSLDELCAFADFANAAGAVCACKAGAIPALPTEAQVLSCMRTTPLLLNL